MGMTEEDRVLILGATGFVGRSLTRELAKRNTRLRLMVRDPSKVSAPLPAGEIELLRGDVVTGDGLREALRGIHSAYYLVHAMGGKGLFRNQSFAEKDRQAARNFLSAADREGLKRIIYLGGLGEEGDDLSEHLRSRAEVAKILSSGKPATTVLRAGIILGAGGASFEMLRYLVERLPIMVCPRWIDSRIQPIALRDVVAYLVGCLLNQKTEGETFDIGGPEIFTYREMMRQYADARGLPRRIILTVPFLTPLLSAYWVDLVTPVPSGIAHPLIEGLKNDLVSRDNRIDGFVPIEKTPFREAVRLALHDEEYGPGIAG